MVGAVAAHIGGRHIVGLIGGQREEWCRLHIGLIEDLRVEAATVVVEIEERSAPPHWNIGLEFLNSGRRRSEPG